MKVTGGQIVANLFSRHRARFSFGIPGTHNIELYDAFLDHPELHPTLVTDEQSAGFMADGVWRSSGEIAVVNVVPGAGITHALSGITEAYLDQIPMLVVGSDIRNDSGRTFQLHEIDQGGVLKSVTKKVFSPASHQELYEQLNEAFTLCRQAPFGPVAILIPANLFLFPGELTETPNPIPPTPLKPADSDVKRVANRLNGVERVGMYVGLGAIGARDLIVDLAERLDAPVFTTISGKGVFPENHPLWCWNVLGQSAPPSLYDLSEKFDVLLAIGCRFGEVATGSYGYSTKPALIHVDLDAQVFDRNYKSEIKLQADAREFTQALLNSGVLKLREKKSAISVAEAHAKVKPLLPENNERVHPPVLFQKLQEVFGPNAKFAADSGNGLFVAMENLRLTQPRSFMVPADYSCMGYCVPAAIGAKMANPGTPVVAVPGDGAFLMTGLELLTAVNQQLGLAVFVLRDGEYSQIKQFQERTVVRTTLTDVFNYDLKGIAIAVGAEYIEMRTNNDIDSVCRRVLSLNQQNKTVICEVLIDYSVATHFTKGAIKVNFGRLALTDKVRLASRLIKRKVIG